MFGEKDGNGTDNKKTGSSGTDVVKEGELTYEMKQTGTYENGEYSLPEKSGVMFDLKCEGKEIQVNTYGKDRGRFRIHDELEAIYEFTSETIGEASVVWLPVADYLTDGYIYLTMREEGHITGLLVLCFPAEPDAERRLIYREIKVLAAISFEEQDVDEAYIAKRVQQIVDEAEKEK